MSFIILAFWGEMEMSYCTFDEITLSVSFL